MTQTATPTAAARELREHIPYLLGAISNLLSIGGSQLYRRAFKLGLTEVRLMWVLAVEPRIPASRAAEIMGMDKAAISRAVATLDRRKLVRIAPDPRDSRQRILELSAEGRRLQDRIMVISRERARRLLEPFSRAEIQTLAELLHRMRAHAPSVNAFDPEELLEAEKP
jgi:DNA-binding MarR family transcriptional regulator